MSEIKVQNLTKKYGSFLAVDYISFEVNKGEVYGFIGKNGAGKTTTINILLSLLQRDSGEIYIQDQPVSFNDVNYKYKVGYVPDVPSFPGYMNAKEFLQFTAEVYNMEKTKIKEKIKETMEFVDLKDSKKTISSYSRGMKQRLAIAQGLLHNPDILIMDEPTSALDPIGRRDVMEIISKLKGKKTIFYSTHILEDVEKVCDRIGLIDNGRMIFEDKIEEIKNKFYDNQFYVETTQKVFELEKHLKSMDYLYDIKQKNNGFVFKIKNKSSNDFLSDLMKITKIKIFKEETLGLEDIFVRLTNENIA